MLRTMQCAACTLVAAALTSCDDRAPASTRDPQADSISAAEVERLGVYAVYPSDAADSLRLRRVRTITLGTAADESPASVDHARLAPGLVYVLDGAARRLRGYRRDGTLAFTLPTRTADGLHTPVGLTVVGDSLYAVDINPRRGVSVVAPDGHLARSVTLGVNSSTTSVTPIAGGLAVATVMQDRALRAGSATIVRLVDERGRVRGDACPPDPLYAASLRRGGMYQLFAMSGVTSAGDAVYCRQPVTPVVQVLSRTGAPRGVIRTAPPFYRRAEDDRQSMNQALVDRFREGWWEHLQFHPRPSGFVSFYSRFNRTSGGSEYRVFACDSAGAAGLRCGTASIAGVPLDFRLPDTLLVADPLADDRQAPRVTVYVLDR